jgi:ubiquinone biosynthesis protein
MWIFRFNRNIKNFFRLLTILNIIISHTLRNWFYSGPFRKIFDPKGKKRVSRAERFRLIVEDLGPTFIKFGQILADRPDLVSENLRIELKKLQSSARPFDDEEAISIIETELGNDVDNVFSYIDRKHIASASIAQVFRATLVNGEKVILKVQRPGIKRKIELDLKLMQIFAKRIHKAYPELSSFNLVSFIDTFGDILLKELDFTHEMSNMLRFTHIFKEDERCHIPRVYSRYCTPRLLVMEYIEGYNPSNIELLREKGFSTQTIAENGVNIVLTMILRHGFFHADPHPGNIFIRGNNQVVLIDHGMCGTLKPKQINGLVNFLLGFSDQNSIKITKALLQLTETKSFQNYEDMEFEIDELIKTYSYLDYNQIDISSLFSDTFKVLMKYGIVIPANLYMLIKTLVTIQNLAEELEAKISLPEMIRPFAKEKIMERFSWESIKGKVVNSVEDYLYLVEHLPRDIREIVTNFKNDGLKHTLKLGDDSISNKQIRAHINRLGVILLIGFMLVCSTLLMIYSKPTDFSRDFFYFSVIIAGFVLVRAVLKSK